MDMVARKLIQKPVLFGREALDHRSMLNLRRPLAYGVIKEGSEKDEEAVQELLSYLISLVGIKKENNIASDEDLQAIIVKQKIPAL